MALFEQLSRLDITLEERIKLTAKLKEIAMHHSHDTDAAVQ